jgi:hypothetical protein
VLIYYIEVWLHNFPLDFYRFCIDGVNFDHNYLQLIEWCTTQWLPNLGSKERLKKKPNARKLILLIYYSWYYLWNYNAFPLNYRCLNYDDKFYMLYRLTLMFTPINLYDNVINCSENIPAPISMCLTPLRTLICCYNNSIIATIALFTATGDTDRIRGYISDFSLSFGTNQHKSNMAP